MRHKYYDDLKQRFFSKADAEEYVAGIEYLVSEEAVRDAEILARKEFTTRGADLPSLMAASMDSDVSDDVDLTSPAEGAEASDDLRAAAYVIHKNFIANFFQLNNSDNPELLGRFALAYAALLDNFLSLSYESRDDVNFKQIIMDVAHSIISYDKSKQHALTLMPKLIDFDLPAEFCLAVVTQIDIDVDSESQRMVMGILDSLYGRDSVWNSASTPINMALSVTPSTPQTMAMMMYTAAAKRCSDHAHNSNIAFLFHMQSCWFSAGNTHGCKFIDKCLPAAVASLTLYKHKASEWRWVLETLAKFPESSMQRRWRNRIVQNINEQYLESPAILNNLGINQTKNCWLRLFSACRNVQETSEDYEPKAVVKGSFKLNSTQ